MHSIRVNHRFFLNLGLLAVLLASCAPAAVTEPPAEPAAPVVVVPSATAAIGEPTQGSAVEAPTEAVEPAPLPVATSRGPDLHATDPSTVSLASGQLQFVEFFRFT